jgi:hypothetical protein
MFVVKKISLFFEKRPAGLNNVGSLPIFWGGNLG